MNNNLTIDEAIKLRDFLGGQCVSYYEADLRSAISKSVKSLDEFISDSEVVVDDLIEEESLDELEDEQEELIDDDN